MHGDGTDLAIVTYGNGYYLSRQAEKLLAADGVKARVIDLLVESIARKIASGQQCSCRPGR